MQSPEAEMVSRVIGVKDFLILLGGSTVGTIISSVDTLGLANVAIGLPIGVVGSTKYVKNLALKEFLMGLGIGMVNGGISTTLTPIADAIDDKIWTDSQEKTKTLRKMVNDMIKDMLKAKEEGAKYVVLPQYGAPTLEETGYTF